jgi:hypothetical protein
MSDFFSPYSPPGVGYDPYLPPGGWPASAEAERAARRASVIMFVLSGLAMACSAMFFMLWMMPLNQFPPEQLQAMQDAAAKSGMPLKAIFLGGGLMIMIPGLILGVLGIWVRTARLAAIITAMIANGLLLAFVILSTLRALLSGESGGGAAAFVPLAVTAVMAWLMVRLTAAARASRMANSMAAQFQAQYWQQPFEPDGGYAPPPPLNPPEK